MQVFADAARAQLVSITSNSMVVSSGARFPVANRGTAQDLPGNTWFKVVLAYGDAYEVCYVRTHTGNGTFNNVLRGQDGTTVTAWPVDKQQTTAFLAPIASDMTLLLESIAGLQTALDGKETPAGALAKIQQYGHGRTLGNTLSDINALRESGVYAASISASTAAGLPLAIAHVIEHYAGATATSAIQRATALSTFASNQKRSFQRTLAANAWSEWFEIASIDSPTFTGAVTVPDNTFDLTKLKYVTRASKGGLTTGATWISHAEDPLQSEVDGANVTSVVLSNTGSFFGRRNNTILWNLAFDGGLQLNGPGLKLSNSVLSSDANTLDYYEEGSFIPEFFGATTAGTPTYTFQNGFYTRIGNIVNWSLRIGLSSKGGMAGYLRIKSMPFVVRAHTAARGACSVSLMKGIAASKTFTQVLAIPVHGNAIVDLLEYTAGQAQTNLLDASAVTDSFEIYLSGSYQVQ